MERFEMETYLLERGWKKKRGGWWSRDVFQGCRLQRAYEKAVHDEPQRLAFESKHAEYKADPEGYHKRHPGSWVGLFGRIGV